MTKKKASPENPWDIYWQKAAQRDKVAPFILPLALVWFIFIIVLSIHLTNEHNKNSKPQHGVVNLQNGVTEFCNGTTMIYKTDNAITTEPNSADC